MSRIAMGFSNTVDYELEWDAQHIEMLIKKTGLRAEDIERKQEITSLKDLLSSILFHMRGGTGCGLTLRDPAIIEAFLEGTQYRVTLGGTNIRAAEVISKLGGTSLVHLVSINPETISNMPDGTEYIGGEKYRCCFPHIALQYPANAHINAGEINIQTPRANRVLYSADIACMQMELAPRFFERLQDSTILVISGFDLILDHDILKKRVQEVSGYLNRMPRFHPVVFYEDGCFADAEKWEIIRCGLRNRIDIYSMNEDELQSLYGQQIDLFSPQDVLDALKCATKKFPGSVIVVHTCHYVLCYGDLTDKIVNSMENGMSVASCRYKYGNVSEILLDGIHQLPFQSEARTFARKIELLDNRIRCLPARQIDDVNVTTVGLGDSFVGGFVFEYCR